MFSKEGMRMAEKHLKYSPSIAIREMKLKSISRLRLATIRMVKGKKNHYHHQHHHQQQQETQKTNDNLCWLRCGDQRTLIQSKSDMEIIVEIFREAGNRSASGFSYNTLGLYILQQRHLLNYAHCCSIPSSQKLEPD